MKAKKPKALARGKMNGHRVHADGGPWGGDIVFIPDGGTMVFRLGPFHGSYGPTGVWKDVRST